MRSALQIKAETAKKLRSIAKARNLSLDELLTAHIPGLGPVDSTPGNEKASQKVRALDSWVRSFSKGTPSLSEEAISRESIYRER